MSYKSNSWPSEQFLISHPHAKRLKNKKFLKLLADEAVDYIMNHPGILCIEQFLARRRILKQEWYDACSKSEDVKQADDLITMELSNRLMLKGATGTGNSKFIQYILPKYSKDHKEHAEYVNSLEKKKSENNDKTYKHYKVVEKPTWTRDE